MQTETINVTGMSCQHCVMSVKKVTTALPGVTAVEVDLDAATVRVDFDPAQIDLAKIKSAIDDQGYEVE